MQSKTIIMYLLVIFFCGCGDNQEEFASSEELSVDIPDGSIVQVLYNDVPVWVEIRNQQAIFSGDIVVGHIDEVEIYEGGPLPASAGRATIASLWDNPSNIDWTMRPSCGWPDWQRIRAGLDMWEIATDGFFQFTYRSYPGWNGPYQSQGWMQFKCAQAGDCVSYQVGNYGQIPHVMGVDGCDDPDDVAHEVGHTLGLFHEHQRVDRGTKISIHWNEIPVDKWINYYIYDSAFPNGKDYGPIDFDSIMIYGSHNNTYCPNTGPPCMDRLGTGDTWHSHASFSPGDLYGMARRYSDSWYTLDSEMYPTYEDIALISVFGFGQDRSMDEEYISVGKFCDDDPAEWNNDDIIEYDPNNTSWTVYCDGGFSGTPWNNDANSFGSVAFGEFSSDPAEDEGFTDVIRNESNYNNWEISESGSGQWQIFNTHVTDDIEDVKFGTFCAASVIEGTSDAIRAYFDPDYEVHKIQVSCSANEAWDDLAVAKIDLSEVILGDIDGNGYSDIVRKADPSHIEIAFGGPGTWFTPYEFYRVDTTINDWGFDISDIHVGKFDYGSTDDLLYQTRPPGCITSERFI